MYESILTSGIFIDKISILDIIPSKKSPLQEEVRMGSKIINPSSYPWREVSAHSRRRGYILVLHQESSEVIRLAESDIITDVNGIELYKGLSSKFLEYLEQYRLPEYDIVQVRAENLTELSRMFGAQDGFSGVEVERITTSQKYIHFISQDGNDAFLTQQDTRRIVRAIFTNVSRGDYGECGEEVMKHMVSQMRHFIDNTTDIFEQALVDALYDELVRK